MLIARIASAVVIGLTLVMVFRFWTLGKQSQQMGPLGTGITQDRLQDCPGKPNCVSSQAAPSDTEHLIAPLNFSSSNAEMKAKILNDLGLMNGFTVTKQAENYISAEFKSGLFGFVDDLELYFPPSSKGVFHVRSASRVGHSDLGANRKRVEALRARLSR